MINRHIHILTSSPISKFKRYRVFKNYYRFPVDTTFDYIELINRYNVTDIILSVEINNNINMFYLYKSYIDTYDWSNVQLSVSKFYLNVSMNRFKLLPSKFNKFIKSSNNELRRSYLIPFNSNSRRVYKFLNRYDNIINSYILYDYLGYDINIIDSFIR
jgi:hypothetical protein